MGDYANICAPNGFTLDRVDYLHHEILQKLTPYEYICKICTTEPKRFRLNPIHHIPGLNT